VISIRLLLTVTLYTLNRKEPISDLGRGTDFPVLFRVCPVSRGCCWYIIKVSHDPVSEFLLSQFMIISAFILRGIRGQSGEYPAILNISRTGRVALT
jgi:hypothetical protein